MTARAAALRVEEVMTPAPTQLHEGCTVAGALTFLVRHRYQAAPVTDDRGRLVGVVSRAGLLARFCALSADGHRAFLESSIGATLLEPPLLVSGATLIGEACAQLIREEAPVALVARGDRVVGILTLQDVARSVAFPPPVAGQDLARSDAPPESADLAPTTTGHGRGALILDDAPWAPPP